MEKVTAFKLWKIHRSIEYRVNKGLPTTAGPAGPGQTNPPTVMEREPEEIADIQDQITDIPALKSVSRVLAKDVKLRWTPREMEMLDSESNKTHREAYQAYVQACQDSMLHVRTFVSFKKKRQEVARHNQQN